MVIPMMARRRREGVVAREWQPSAVIDLPGARRAALAAELAAAAEALARDPDAAALLLDGLLRRVAAGWFQVRGLAVPDAEDLLGRLADEDAPFAWRVRLALRAPDARARFVAAGQCLCAM
jgi:hypothetical protein